MIRNNIVFVLLIGLLVGCSGGKDGRLSEITKENLTGRWQPERLEFKDIPTLIRMQFPKEEIERLENELLSEQQKNGYLELKGDGTFIFKDTPSGDEHVGKWSFDGEKTIEIEITGLKVGSEEKDLKIGFYVESIAKDQLEIDYASMYKTMTGMEKIPFFDIKMVMRYKRIN